MVDYDKSVGLTATMRIRDNGYRVEFWLKSGYSSTWFGSRTFSYSSPNGSGTWEAGYSSGNTWQLMGAINVSSSGNVSWTVPYTGTSQIGGPHTQTVYLNRATVPPAPTRPVFSEIKHESVKVQFSSTGTGGAAIIEWQLRFGPDGSAILSSKNWNIVSSGTSVVTGLKPGSYYAAWARGRNSVGWGPWSAGASFYTLAGCHVKVNGAWKPAVPYVKVNGVWMPSVPYVKVADAWATTAS